MGSHYAAAAHAALEAAAPGLGTALMAAGALVFAVGAAGLLRLPDFYARLSAVTIAAAPGTALLLLGLLLHYPTWENTLKIGLAILIQLATAAVGGHALARAGYLTGAPAAAATRFDDIAARAAAGGAEGGDHRPRRSRPERP